MNARALPVEPQNNALRLHVTQFPTVAGSVKNGREISWGELARLLERPTEYPAKAACPLLSLAAFGEKRSAKGSYRFNANVTAITGLVADYDGEKVSPAEAVRRLQAANVEALVYTSASHMPDRPRWRVVAPLHAPSDVAGHSGLMDALNGALGGILNPESWTPTQSYYYGRVTGAAYECARSVGGCLDLLDDLGLVERIGKPGAACDSPDSANDQFAGMERAQRLASVTAETIADLRSALDHLAQNTDRARAYSPWIETGHALASLKGTAREADALDLWHRFSASDEAQYDRDVAQDRWDGFSPSRITFASIFQWAQAAGWENPRSKPATLTAADMRAKLADRNIPAHELEAEIIPALRQAQLGLAERDSIVHELAKRLGVPPAQVRAAAKPVTPSDASIAEMFLRAIGPENMAYIEGALYAWDGERGMWRRVPPGSAYLGGLVKKHVGGYIATGPKLHSVMTLVTASVPHIDEPEVDPMLINCPNGELRLDRTTGAWSLQPHRRENYLRQQIAVAYDPTAKAPLFERTLREIFAGADDHEARIALVKETIGYCLMRTLLFEYFFVFLGSGANGKSTILAVIEKLAGKDNCTALEPTDMDDKFMRAQLRDKLVNLIPEIRIGDTLPEHHLKKLSTGEPTQVSEKFEKPFLLKTHATPVFGTNELPYVRDATRGFWRRTMLLDFPNDLTIAGVDVHRKTALEAELPGILNVVLAAVGRAIQRGKMTEPPSAAVNREAWRRECDQVTPFVEERCVREPQRRVSMQELYDAYGQWAKATGVNRTFAQRRFAAALKARCGLESRKSTGGLYYVEGIRLRTIEEQAQNLAAPEFEEGKR